MKNHYQKYRHSIQKVWPETKSYISLKDKSWSKMLDRIKADDFLTIYAEGKVKIDTVFAWGLGIEVSSLSGVEKTEGHSDSLPFIKNLWK